MAFAFNEAGQLAAPMWMTNDQDGRVIIHAIAHTTLTLATPYRIIYNEYGPLTKAIADDQDTYRVAVAKAATTTGNIAELVHGGPYAAMVTASLSMAVGEALKISGGAVADEAADFGDIHDNMFAVSYTASSSASTQDVIMVPEPITAT